MDTPDDPGAAVLLRPGEGRSCPMGRIAAVFKADGAETAERYSVMSFLVDAKWVDAPKGSFVLVPAGVTHDFENRTDRRSGVLNFSIPGGFEEDMPDIVDWFAKHPPGNAGDPTGVIASTDCGFGTFAGSEMVAPSVVWAKLAALRDSAARATARLWGRPGGEAPAAR